MDCNIQRFFLFVCINFTLFNYYLYFFRIFMIKFLPRHIEHKHFDIFRYRCIKIVFVALLRGFKVSFKKVYKQVGL